MAAVCVLNIARMPYSEAGVPLPIAALVLLLHSRVSGRIMWDIEETYSSTLNGCSIAEHPEGDEYSVSIRKSMHVRLMLGEVGLPT